MNQTTRRVLRTEMLRGAAPVAAVGCLLAGFLLMYSMAEGWAGWAGRWMPFAASLRQSLYVVGAVAVGTASWQAGRERRRRVREHVAAAARPAWQPFVVSWAAVTLGSLAGLFVVVAIGAALVAPVASYAGGGWWWVLMVAFPGLAAFSALGAALGRLLPSRLTPPVAAIVTYLTMVGAIDTSQLGSVRLLAPVLSQYDGPGHTLGASVSAYQAVWFAGLSATVLVLVAARRRWLAAIPAAVAVIGAVPLLTESASLWQVDRSASELVCTDDAGPEVCLTRLNAFLLDDVTAPAREALARWEGIPDGPQRAVDDVFMYMQDDLGTDEPADVNGRGGALSIHLDGGVRLPGQLERVDEPMGVVSWWPDAGCSDEVVAYDRYGALFEIAAAWGSGLDELDWVPAPERSGFDALLARPMDTQWDWMSRFLSATETCNRAALDALREELL